MKSSFWHVFPLVILFVCTAGLVSADDNLAAGKIVQFLPTPNYAITAKGDTDATDLTDGKLSSREDNRLWFDRQCVGFSYPGLQQMYLDLGAEESIREVAIRFMGGSVTPGTSFPVWVDLVASLDGQTYERLDSFSRWTPGDRERFGIPQEAGEAWGHQLTFGNLKVKARYIGLSFYGTGLNVADEMWVIRGGDDAKPLALAPTNIVPFCPKGAQAYFHKPVVQFSTNFPTPNPVGLLSALPKDAKPTLRLDLPPGVRLVGTEQEVLPQSEKLSDGWTRYHFAEEKTSGESLKTWQRIYLTGDWKPGQEGVLRYQVSWPDGQSPEGTQRIQAVEIPETPVPKKLLTGLGWWSMGNSAHWPNVIPSYKRLGFSYVPLFARWISNEKEWALLDQFRNEGFKVVSIDSPLHVLLQKHKKNSDIYCQLEKGPGELLCPSYRGPAYQEELVRLATEASKARPDLYAADIELWGWRGPVDAENCSRCKADFNASGLSSWEEWKITKGNEMWKDMASAVRKGSVDAGGPKTESGGYDFQPGKNYQFLWSVDQLYPDAMQNSQVSTYSSLEPWNIAYIGDEVRKDRQQIAGSDIIPWLTPGDAGVFPGWAMRDSVLECFANGARGILFWSSRVWDTEGLLGYADAIRIATPVEDIIVGGKLLEGVKTQPEVRVSGVQNDKGIFLLLGDYQGSMKGKAVTLTVSVDRAMSVVDLVTGKEVAKLAPDANSFQIEFKEAGSRAFSLR